MSDNGTSSATIEKAPPRHDILVVDDQADCCSVMRDVFEDLGYRVDTALDPATALALVRCQSYRVALIDLCVAGSDGLTLCRDIRTALPQRLDFIVMGDPTDPRFAEARNDGVTAVVIKPVDIPRLLTIITHALENTGTEENQPNPRVLLARDHWLESLEAEILRCTARRVRHLKVSRGAHGLVVSAKVATFHLKQLVIHAALHATDKTLVVDFDVDVTS